jgi:hypothetical protein
MKSACRRAARLALPVVLQLVGFMSIPAAADEWVEPKFDPVVGSKWIVQREVNVQKTVSGTLLGHTLKQSALLTVEEKTADGYVMSYARQNSSYDGNPAGASAARLTFAAEQGVVLRLATDANGKPLRIVNLGELKSALKGAIDALPMDTANPETAAAIHAVANRITSVDDKQAAALYLDELPTLALGQNTGLQPGEIRRATLPVANALVSGITKNVTMSIVKDDPAAGKVRYLMTETFDPSAMKALVGDTLSELALTPVNSGSMDGMMNSAVVAAVARAQLDVAGGMTRELRRQSVTSFRAPGARSTVTEDELVTIAPAD